MLQLPRIPELAQRDRFVRRAVAEGRVLTLADEEMASVPSQKGSDRTVQLFWSNKPEALRWAEALAGDCALQEIALKTFAADIVPGLAGAKGLIGCDWIPEPIEAEVDPGDLLIRLKFESIPARLAALVDRGEVFLVAGEDGPCLEPATLRGNPAPRMSLFSTRSDADRHKGRSGGLSVTADPIGDFRSSTLPWAISRGCVVAFEPIEGAGPIDLAATDLADRLDALR